VTVASRAALIAGLLLLGSVAHAQPAQTPQQKEADEAFKKGRDLLKQGNFIDACDEFNKSHRLDPANGTLFNIAQCSEQIGRLATAASAYRELIKKDTNAERLALSRKALAALEPRIPKIVAKIDNPPKNILITLDSKAGSASILPNEPVDANFGEYTLIARAKGYTEMISKFRIGEEGSTKTVEVTLLPGSSNSDIIKKPGERSTDKPPRNMRKLAGMGLTVAGVATLGTGVAFGFMARSRWDDAKKACGGATCDTMEKLNNANALSDEARSKATLSTILVAGGAVVAGAGIALWVTAPKGMQVTPTASESSAGVTLSGSF
jgi:tetratricopeptide (TPR) repeat protein